MKQKLLSFFKLLLFFLIGVLLLWLVLRHQDISAIKKDIAEANWWWAIITLVAAFMSNWFRALRWNMLFEPLGFKPRLVNTFGALMIGYFANLAFPRLGEVTRCVPLNRYEKIPLNQSLGTVVVERVIDVLTIFLLLFILLLFEFNRLSAFANASIFNPLGDQIKSRLSQGTRFYLVLALIVVVLAVILWVLIRRMRNTHWYTRVRHTLLGFIDGLKSVGKLRSPALFLLYTFLIWLMYFLMSFVCFYSFGETAHLGVLAGLAVMVLGGFGFAAPVPGGLGAFEFMVSGTLLAYGISSTTADAYTLFVHALQWMGVVVFGLGAFILLPVYNRKKPS